MRDDPSGRGTGHAGSRPGHAFRVAPGVLARRRERLVGAVEARGLAALVVYGNPSIFGIATRTHGHLRYLCGWTDRFAPSLLVAPSARPPILLVPTPDAVAKARELTGVNDIRREDPGRYGLAVRRLLSRLAPRERVGLVGLDEMPAPVAVPLLEPGPFRPVRADRLLERLRLIKGPEEIAVLRRAAVLTDRMLAVLFAEGGRGPRRAYQVRARMELAAKVRGAEFATAWITRGSVPDRQRYMPEESDYRFTTGDQILSGMYLQYAGYWGHALRMGSKGPPGPSLRRNHARIRDVLEGACEWVRPGREVGGLARHLATALDRAFPGHDGLTFRPAHGIGLDYSERPISDFFPQPYAAVKGPRPAPLAFAPGMVLELHPNVMDPAVGFAALGDLCLVTPTGCEPLTRFPRELAVV